MGSRNYREASLFCFFAIPTICNAMLKLLKLQLVCVYFTYQGLVGSEFLFLPLVWHLGQAPPYREECKIIGCFSEQSSTLMRLKIKSHFLFTGVLSLNHFKHMFLSIMLGCEGESGFHCSIQDYIDQSCKFFRNIDLNFQTKKTKIITISYRTTSLNKPIPCNVATDNT